MANTNTKTETAELERRITEVYKLLLGSYKRADILRYASEKGWGVTERSIENYISKANTKIKEEGFDKRKLMKKQAIFEYNDILRRSKKDRQYGVALGCQTAKNKMFGLDEPEEHNHNIQITELKDLLGNSIEVDEDN